MESNSRLLRYTQIKRINSGGMASVFLAHDTVLNRAVAVKQVHPHLLQHPETIKRFFNEAKAIAAVSHENIIKIYDFGDDEQQPFIVMEYIDGTTLEELIHLHGSLPNIAVAEIARQVVSGLQCAHAAGIIHRDIKPANILINKQGCVKITDFGIAFLVNAEPLTHTGSFIGSSHYIAPELISGKSVSGKTDVFSLGVTLFRSLTGILPFDAETAHGIMNAILHTPLVFPPIEANPRLFWLADLIDACLIKDTAARPDPAETASRLAACSRLDNFPLGNQRLIDFIADPPAARVAEAREIFANYRNRTIDSLSKRDIPSGIRHVEQAKIFGRLSGEDQRFIDRVLQRSRIRQLTGKIFIALAIMLAVLTPAIAVYRWNAQKKPIGTPVPVPHTSQHRTPDSTTPVFGNRRALPPPSMSQKSVSQPPAKPVSRVAPPSPSPIDSSSSHPVASKNLKEELPFLLQGTGFISLVTNPPWTTIVVDDVNHGKTPVTTVFPVPVGRHFIKLSKNGFLDYTQIVSVGQGDTAFLRIKLTAAKKDTSAQ